ncbi:MAG: Ig-like domain-containing protein, partial [Saccharospirillum sp.]|nr:Ig-like domain-containing protein [Saccharospirillum sp.]
DAVGNTANANDDGTIDVTAPMLTVDAPDSNDTTPTITGTSDEIGATVTVVVTDAKGDDQTLTSVVQPDATWSVDVTTPLAEGDYSVDASVNDAVGNTANANDDGTIDVTAPTLTVDAPDSNDTTPTISGTSDEIGATVTVFVTDANNVEQTLTAAVQPDGTWSVDVTAPLAEGDYTVDASVSDAVGNTASANDDGTIDVTAPMLTVDAPDSNDTTPTITGTSDEIGATVTVVVTDSNGDDQTLNAVVQPDGTWSVDVTTPLAEGDYTVDASVSDAVGNTANANDDGTIDVTAPTLTVDAPDSNDTTPTITGTSDEIGATVTVVVTDSNGDDQTLTAVVQPDGTWSVDVITPLAEGDYTVDASVSDAVGNTANANDDGTIDTTAPTLTVDAPDSNDTTPTISGTSDEIGATVTVVVTDANGDDQTLTAVVQPDGTWSVDVTTPLAEGDYSVDASVSDAVGNTANANDDGTIDLTAPTLTLDAPDSNNTSPTITGTSDEIGATVTVVVTDANNFEQTLTTEVQPDGTWSVDVTTPLAEGDYSVDASVSDAVGNTANANDDGTIDVTAPTLTLDAPDSNNTSPTITGTSDEIGATVTVVVTDANNVEQTLTTEVQPDGTWSVDVTTPLAEGTYSVDASVSDAVGNTANANDNGTIDLTAPTLTVDAPDSNDTAPTITGTSDEVGATVTVVVTDANNAEQTLTAVVQPDSTWSVDVTAPLAEGTYSVDASVSDAVGNTANANDNGTIDTTAPTLTVDAPDSNDTTPTITGTSDEIGATVTVVVTDASNVEQTLTAVVQPDGTWSADVTTPLAEGDYSVDASVSDAVGNTANANDDGTIDATAPIADPVLTTANAGSLAFLPDDIILYKKISIGGGVDADEAGLSDPIVQESSATLGGEDNQSSESNLVFNLTELPSFGTLYVISESGEASPISELPADSFNINTEFYWAATKEQLDAAASNESFTIGGPGANLSAWQQHGVTIHGYDYLGAKGDFLTFDNRGMGVDSADSFDGSPPDAAHAPAQLGYRNGATETIVVNFSNPAKDATITVSGLWPNESTGEAGRVEAFLNGQSVGSWTFTSGSGETIDGVPIDFTPANGGFDPSVGVESTPGGSGAFTLSGVVFDQLRFTATEYPDGGTKTNDNSEYFLQEIQFVDLEAPPAEFQYAVTDEAGNTSDPVKVVIVNEGTAPSDFIGGSSLVDEFVGTGDNEIIVAGPNDMTLTGNGGADVFRWELGDQGTSSTPAQDVITDFTLGVYTGSGEADRLDLADLLLGEDESNLLDYILAETSGDDTILYINHEGNLSNNSDNADQVITLQGITMGSGQTSEEFIQTLLNNGQLNIDS